MEIDEIMSKGLKNIELQEELDRLKQEKSKLINLVFEAFKAGRFSVIDNKGNGLLESWERFKASQTMKEVCGEEKKG